MNKLVIIPICDFFDCIYTIVSFYLKNLDEADIIIVTDGVRDNTEWLQGSIQKNCIIIRNSKPGNLRNAIYSAYKYMQKSRSYDLVITNEHDVIPNEDSLYACLHVFEDKKAMRGMASVSTVYKWNGKDCYPSHPNWYNGWTVLNGYGVGECKIAAAQGIPFGFALWKPEIIDLLNNKDLPLIWKLDSRFGELVYSKGYHHIRLVDYYVEHYKQGVKSWKNISTF